MHCRSSAPFAEKDNCENRERDDEDQRAFVTVKTKPCGDSRAYRLHECSTRCSRFVKRTQEKIKREKHPEDEAELVQLADPVQRRVRSMENGEGAGQICCRLEALIQHPHDQKDEQTAGEPKSGIYQLIGYERTFMSGPSAEEEGQV